MPVILKEAAHAEWLDPEMKDAERVAAPVASARGTVLDAVELPWEWKVAA